MKDLSILFSFQTLKISIVFFYIVICFFQLKDEMFSLDKDVIIKHVYIDKELGKDTSFTVTSRALERVADVALRSPSGVIYDASNPHYNRDDDVRSRIQILIPEAEVRCLKFEYFFYIY